MNKYDKEQQNGITYAILGLTETTDFDSHLIRKCDWAGTKKSILRAKIKRIKEII
jgi:hypothetical protein